MQRRERKHHKDGRRSSFAGTARGILLQVGRALTLAALLVAAVAVSVGLANSGGERPTTGAPEPAAPSTAALSAAQKQESATVAAAATARLVSDEDARVLDLVRQVPYVGAAYRVSTGATDTWVLTARAAPYDRASLVALGALVPGKATDYLRTSLLVAPGAKLHLSGGQPIRMRSDAVGFASIVAWKGELRLTGGADSKLSITSWDKAAQRADTDVSDGRAFIRTVGSRTEVRDVELDELGFWSGRTGGLSVEGGGELASVSAPVADAAVSPFAGRDQVTIDNLVTRGLHYGIYAHDIRSGAVTRTQLVDSAMQGLLMHGNTRGLVVEDTEVSGSGSDGLAVARGSHDLVLRNVVSEDNTGNGIRVDGRPMAIGPTAGGADPQRHGDVRIVGASLSDNAKSGAAVVGAVRVSITGSNLRANADGITVRDRAADVRLSDNRILDSRGFGIGVTDGPAEVTVQDNEVAGSETGVALRAAVATVRRNEISNATQHGVSVVGRAAGSEVVDNTIAGVGPDALALTRLVAPTTVVVDANDSSEWKVEKDLTWSERLEDHPLLLLWLPILFVPLAAGLVSIRRRRARSDRSKRRAKARLSVANAATSSGVAKTNHPSVLEPEPDTRTRVTVMS